MAGPHHGGSSTREYISWRRMKARCYNQHDTNYRYYGGRGITVCDRWLHDFQAFLADVGPTPSRHHSLDRYPDNDGNYEPGNVRWATKREQALNTRRTRTMTLNGETLPLRVWAQRYGIKWLTLQERVNRGVPPAEAIKPTLKRAWHSRLPARKR